MAAIRDNFYVYGKFYNYCDGDEIIQECRSHLYIIRKSNLVPGEDVEKANQDVNVLMMNPGTSRPLHENEEINEVQLPLSNRKAGNVPIIEANPDNTQSRIMSIMNEMGWNRATVINLSDVRDNSKTNSTGRKAWQQIKSFEKQFEGKPYKKDHSIFSENRNEELSSVLNKNVPLIIAWGCYKGMNSLKQIAHSYLEGESLNYYCVKSKSSDLSYYHPLYSGWKSGILEVLRK
ncbi:DUF1643 domain-containing protein [Pontibacillus halophilus]|uniref:DUF1643 domain-containing protein n=1 Tax=Pontibacillus halophilus TaxID=516704 RepID=UPI0003F4B44C|nr:DUF1643 domain-containing protein [Pontibacillus halophilus]